MGFDLVIFKGIKFIAINILILIFTFCVNFLVLRGLLSQKNTLNKLQFYSIRKRDIHSQQIPRLGGVAFYISFFFSIYFSHIFFHYGDEHNLFILHTLFVLTIAFTNGILDDLFNLHYIYKLLFQFFLSLAIIRYFGYMHVFMFPGFTSYHIPNFIGFIITMILILIIINGINFIDGMDALAAGVILIGSIVLYIHSFILYHALHIHLYLLIILFYLALIGILSSFLFYNKRPAQIFMGESGVLFLGTIVSILLCSIFDYLGDIEEQYTIFSSQTALIHKYNTLYLPVLMFLPTLIIPILDLISTVFLRITKKTSPLIADNNHIHHRLMTSGYSYKGVLFSIYLVSSYLGILSLFFSIYSLKHYFIHIAIILTIITIFGLLIIRQFYRINI